MDGGISGRSSASLGGAAAGRSGTPRGTPTLSTNRSIRVSKHALQLEVDMRRRVVRGTSTIRLTFGLTASEASHVLAQKISIENGSSNSVPEDEGFGMPVQVPLAASFSIVETRVNEVPANHRPLLSSNPMDVAEVVPGNKRDLLSFAEATAPAYRASFAILEVLVPPEVLVRSLTVGGKRGAALSFSLSVSFLLTEPSPMDCAIYFAAHTVRVVAPSQNGDTNSPSNESSLPVDRTDGSLREYPFLLTTPSNTGTAWFPTIPTQVYLNPTDTRKKYNGRFHWNITVAVAPRGLQCVATGSRVQMWSEEHRDCFRFETRGSSAELSPIDIAVFVGLLAFSTDRLTISKDNQELPEKPSTRTEAAGTIDVEKQSSVNEESTHGKTIDNKSRKDAKQNTLGDTADSESTFTTEVVCSTLMGFEANMMNAVELVPLAMNVLNQIFPRPLPFSSCTFLFLPLGMPIPACSESAWLQMPLAGTGQDTLSQSLDWIYSASRKWTCYGQRHNLFGNVVVLPMSMLLHYAEVHEGLVAAHRTVFEALANMWLGGVVCVPDALRSQNHWLLVALHNYVVDSIAIAAFGKTALEVELATRADRLFRRVALGEDLITLSYDHMETSGEHRPRDHQPGVLPFDYAFDRTWNLKCSLVLWALERRLAPMEEEHRWLPPGCFVQFVSNYLYRLVSKAAPPSTDEFFKALTNRLKKLFIVSGWWKLQHFLLPHQPLPTTIAGFKGIPTPDDIQLENFRAFPNHNLEQLLDDIGEFKVCWIHRLDLPQLSLLLFIQMLRKVKASDRLLASVEQTSLSPPPSITRSGHSVWMQACRAAPLLLGTLYKELGGFRQDHHSLSDTDESEVSQYAYAGLPYHGDEVLEKNGRTCPGANYDPIDLFTRDNKYGLGFGFTGVESTPISGGSGPLYAWAAHRMQLEADSSTGMALTDPTVPSTTVSLPATLFTARTTADSSAAGGDKPAPITSSIGGLPEWFPIWNSAVCLRGFLPSQSSVLTKSLPRRSEPFSPHVYGGDQSARSNVLPVSYQFHPDIVGSSPSLTASGASSPKPADQGLEEIMSPGAAISRGSVTSPMEKKGVAARLRVVSPLAELPLNVSNECYWPVSLKVAVCEESGKFTEWCRVKSAKSMGCGIFDLKAPSGGAARLSDEAKGTGDPAVPRSGSSAHGAAEEKDPSTEKTNRLVGILSGRLSANRQIKRPFVGVISLADEQLISRCDLGPWGQLLDPQNKFERSKSFHGKKLPFLWVRYESWGSSGLLARVRRCQSQAMWENQLENDTSVVMKAEATEALSRFSGFDSAPKLLLAMRKHLDDPFVRGLAVLGLVRLNNLNVMDCYLNNISLKEEETSHLLYCLEEYIQTYHVKSGIKGYSSLEKSKTTSYDQENALLMARHRKFRPWHVSEVLFLRTLYFAIALLRTPRQLSPSLAVQLLVRPLEQAEIVEGGSASSFFTAHIIACCGFLALEPAELTQIPEQLIASASPDQEVSDIETQPVTMTQEVFNNIWRLFRLDVAFSSPGQINSRAFLTALSRHSSFRLLAREASMREQGCPWDPLYFLPIILPVKEMKRNKRTTYAGAHLESGLQRIHSLISTLPDRSEPAAKSRSYVSFCRRQLLALQYPSCQYEAVVLELVCVLSGEAVPPRIVIQRTFWETIGFSEGQNKTPEGMRTLNLYKNSRYQLSSLLHSSHFPSFGTEWINDPRESQYLRRSGFAVLYAVKLLIALEDLLPPGESLPLLQQLWPAALEAMERALEQTPDTFLPFVMLGGHHDMKEFPLVRPMKSPEDLGRRKKMKETTAVRTGKETSEAIVRKLQEEEQFDIMTAPLSCDGGEQLPSGVPCIPGIAGSRSSHVPPQSSNNQPEAQLDEETVGQSKKRPRTDETWVVEMSPVEECAHLLYNYLRYRTFAAHALIPYRAHFARRVYAFLFGCGLPQIFVRRKATIGPPSADATLADQHVQSPAKDLCRMFCEGLQGGLPILRDQAFIKYCQTTTRCLMPLIMKEHVRYRENIAPDETQTAEVYDGSSASSPTNWRDLATRMTKALMKLPQAEQFRDPVNVQVAPDYYHVIKQPMWLRKVLEGLRKRRGSYRTIDEWKKDMFLVFRNCRTYNTAGSQITKDCDGVQAILYEMLRRASPLFNLMESMANATAHQAGFAGHEAADSTRLSYP